MGIDQLLISFCMSPNPIYTFQTIIPLAQLLILSFFYLFSFILNSRAFWANSLTTHIFCHFFQPWTFLSLLPSSISRIVCSGSYLFSSSIFLSLRNNLYIFIQINHFLICLYIPYNLTVINLKLFFFYLYYFFFFWKFSTLITTFKIWHCLFKLE